MSHKYPWDTTTSSSGRLNVLSRSSTFVKEKSDFSFRYPIRESQRHKRTVMLMEGTAATVELKIKSRDRRSLQRSHNGYDSSSDTGVYFWPLAKNKEKSYRMDKSQIRINGKIMKPLLLNKNIKENYINFQQTKDDYRFNRGFANFPVYSQYKSTAGGDCSHLDHIKNHSIPLFASLMLNIRLIKLCEKHCENQNLVGVLWSYYPVPFLSLSSVKFVGNHIFSLLITTEKDRKLQDSSISMSTYQSSFNKTLVYQKSVNDSSISVTWSNMTVVGRQKSYRSEVKVFVDYNNFGLTKSNKNLLFTNTDIFEWHTCVSLKPTKRAVSNYLETKELDKFSLARVVKHSLHYADDVWNERDYVHNPRFTSTSDECFSATEAFNVTVKLKNQTDKKPQFVSHGDLNHYNQISSLKNRNITRWISNSNVANNVNILTNTMTPNIIGLSYLYGESFSLHSRDRSMKNFYKDKTIPYHGPKGKNYNNKKKQKKVSSDSTSSTKNKTTKSENVSQMPSISDSNIVLYEPNVYCSDTKQTGLNISDDFQLENIPTLKNKLSTKKGCMSCFLKKPNKERNENLEIGSITTARSNKTGSISSMVPQWSCCCGNYK